MTKNNKKHIQNSAEDRMIHSIVSVTVNTTKIMISIKYGISSKMQKLFNYSKGRHYTVKNFHIVKFCQIKDFYKNFQNFS